MKLNSAKTIDIKGKMVVVKNKNGDLSDTGLGKLMDEVKTMGGLGVIVLPEGSEISTLGVKEVEQILKHMKESLKAKQ